VHIIIINYKKSERRLLPVFNNNKLKNREKVAEGKVGHKILHIRQMIYLMFQFFQLNNLPICQV
jgi:hypothetical protein